jgi:hypothetical protein
MRLDTSLDFFYCRDGKLTLRGGLSISPDKGSNDNRAEVDELLAVSMLLRDQ